MTNNTDSAHYAISPDAMGAQEMGLHTRPSRPDWDPPSREELGARTFHEIKHLMENGYSQVLTKDHAAKIVAMASKLLND